MAKKKPVPTAETLSADIQRLFELMNSASDLAVAIVAHSYLDAALECRLRAWFVDSEAALALLDTNGHLNSFGARCDAARAVGLISAAHYADLKKLGKIRNRFAHHHIALDFGDSQIKGWCDALSLNRDPIDVDTGKPIKVPHISEAHRIRELPMSSDKTPKIFGAEWFDLTPDEYSAIGKVAVQSAYLEDALELLICLLARTNIPTAEALMGRAMLGTKLAIFQRLAETRLVDRPDAVKELKALMQKTRDQISARAVAIHGFWLAGTLGDLASTNPTRRPRALKKDREMDIAEAVALSAQIDESRLVIHDFCRKTWPQLFARRTRKEKSK